MVQCLTRNRGDAGSRHCVVFLACHFIFCLVLVQPRKTRPDMTEKCYLGCKESNQMFLLLMCSEIALVNVCINHWLQRKKVFPGYQPGLTRT